MSYKPYNAEDRETVEWFYFNTVLIIVYKRKVGDKLKVKFEV